MQLIGSLNSLEFFLSLSQNSAFIDNNPRQIKAQNAGITIVAGLGGKGVKLYDLKNTKFFQHFLPCIS